MISPDSDFTKLKQQQLNKQINVFKRNNCSLQVLLLCQTPNKFPSLLFMTVVVGKEAAVLIEVRRGEKEKPSRLAETIQLKESCHFADLWTRKKNKIKNLNLAVTSQDLQFVSDLCALLIEIFNLGVL